MGTTYIKKDIPEKEFCNDYVTMKGVVDSFQFIGLIRYKYHNMTI